MAGRRRKRLCIQCGNSTEEVYTDDEWKVLGQMCEECYILEFPEGEFEENDMSHTEE